MDSLIFSSVENIPGVSARAAFTVNSAAVFREDCDIMPSTFGTIKYMPWGADNQMPYNIIDLIERDETLATCQIFNAEICYGAGLVYDTSQVESRETSVERIFPPQKETFSGRS